VHVQRRGAGDTLVDWVTDSARGYWAHQMTFEEVDQVRREARGETPDSVSMSLEAEPNRQ
jgi:hypothetical protein